MSDALSRHEFWVLKRSPNRISNPPTPLVRGALEELFRGALEELVKGALQRCCECALTDHARLRRAIVKEHDESLWSCVHFAREMKRVIRSWPRLLATGLMLLLVLAVLLAGCAGSTSTVSGGVVNIVAAENFWGSIASQLGGSHANVTSIVSNPNTDPHEYESSAQNARSFAQANYVIVTGAGYDSWADKLLSANPSSGRKVLNIAELLGKKAGDNPHFWYDPGYVSQVADQITKDLQALDPPDATYFTQQRTAFENALKPYHDQIAAIKQSFAGRKIGATESIFVYMASALGLDLISPPAFMLAISEGNEPPVDSVTTFQQQITGRQIAVLIYNKQTVTAVTTNMQQLAAQNNIPVMGVSETVQPATASFQDWQVAQLIELQNALRASTTGK